jgi:hypothetical protein
MFAWVNPTVAIPHSYEGRKRPEADQEGTQGLEGILGPKIRRTPESSFAHVSARLELHHQVKLCATTVRKITLVHAAAIAELETPTGGVSPAPAGGADCIVSGINGTILPVVRTQAKLPGGEA